MKHINKKSSKRNLSSSESDKQRKGRGSKNDKTNKLTPKKQKDSEKQP
jgi:hypothetical protein